MSDPPESDQKQSAKSEKFKGLGAKVNRRSHATAIAFAIGGAALGGVLELQAADLAEWLRPRWPEAQIDAGLPGFGAVLAALASVVFFIWPRRITAEILHIADWTVLFYGLYAFHSSIVELPAGPVLFWAAIVAFVVGYTWVKWGSLIRPVFGGDSTGAKFGLGILLAVAATFVLAPAIVLTLE